MTQEPGVTSSLVRPEVWITPRDAAAVEADRRASEERRRAGAHLPLAGLTFAVKDNIDVAGITTTAACPAFAFTPTTSASCVEALLAAGATYAGKTNMDQFATGLVGTRSPYGAVRNAIDPDRISGGSSSGSAVAVALGQVDFALGTDTAGSGRVPAALNGVVGLKPTRGLVPTDGVLPACRSFDCVSIFARSVALAERVLAVIADPSAAPPTAPLAPPSTPVVGTAVIAGLSQERAASYRTAADRLAASGCRMVEIDLAPFLEAGRLLYQGAFLAERYAAVGAWVDEHPGEVDPVVGPLIAQAGTLRASALVQDQARLDELRNEVARLWRDHELTSLLLPTVTDHPLLTKVAADPLGVNAALGTYTHFVNLLDLCAVAVPAPWADELPFGVSVIGPAWSDAVQAQLARRIADEPEPTDALRPPLPSMPLAVAGAHLTGQPLNGQLTDRGATLRAVSTTSAHYRLYALATDPPKPGLVRDDLHGEAIEIEVWELPPVGFADFVAQLPAPMTVGPVTVADGTQVTGFGCQPSALDGATDITAYGGWRNYLNRNAPPDAE